MTISEITDLQDFEIYGNRLEKYRGNGGRITIPNGVTEIGKDAFWGNKSVTEIVIPEGVTKIDARTFERCINLFEVKLPKSLRYIGEEAFLRCKKLFHLTFEGSEEQWKEIEKHPKWSAGTNKKCQVFVRTGVQMLQFIGEIKKHVN